MSPKGNVSKSVGVGDVLSLCERGKWLDVSGLITGIQSEAEAAFAQGCVLVLTRPEEAKDALSKAIRLLPAGELKERATLWLATAYWSTGEAREARAVLDAIEASTPPIKFLVGLNASIFAGDNLKDASKFLSTTESLIDSVPDLYKAKFFLQRGWVNRRAGKADAAIIDYEASRVLFEQSDAPRYLAAATNNLAGLLVDAKRYADAHDAVDSAIRSLRDDKLYLAQMYDQKALIFIAEHKYSEAEQYASHSVDLLIDSDNRAVLADSLITHAKALKELERYVDALMQLEQARRLAEYLDSKNLRFSVAKEEKETAQALAHTVHIETVETALDLSGGSLRGAARLVGVAVQPLDRFIRLHKIKCHPKVRKSVITKSHKRLVTTSKILKKNRKN